MVAPRSFEDRIGQINREHLTPIVRRAVANEHAEVDQWEQTRLGGAGGGLWNSAVYRFAGTCRDRSESQNWSLILKVVREGQNEPPSSSHYWKREFEAYRSGWLTHLPGDSLAAPACYGTEEYSGEGCWLWLEDLSIVPQEPWSLEQYRLTARNLGQFNGSYLVSEPLPSYPWISQNWIRQDVAIAGKASSSLERAPNAAFGRRILHEERREKLLQLYSERDLFFSALDKLPRTCAHLDAFRGNLFARRTPDGRHQTIAIDWAFTGIEALGAELASLFWVSLLYVDMPASQTANLDQAIFEGYLEGLHDAGWTGDPALVRLGFTAAVGLRHFGTMYYAAPMFNDEAAAFHFADGFGHSTEDVQEQWVSVGEYIDRLTDEARWRINELP